MSAGLTPETPPGLSAEARSTYRRTLRRQLVERRLALPPDSFSLLCATIREHLRSHFPQLSGLRVAFCWPVKNEPDLRPLMSSWLASGAPGFAALLPVVNAVDAPLSFRAWTPASPMIEDRYGIPVPAEGAFLLPQALLIPVNAFDAAGFRLGYGGGFFDRTLAALEPAPLSIGVGFELARVDSVLPEAHDVRLDAMVSEAGVFRHVRT
jgi:5,10-methenyltetrahydrofolate synthetase